MPKSVSTTPSIIKCFLTSPKKLITPEGTQPYTLQAMIITKAEPARICVQV